MEEAWEREAYELYLAGDTYRALCVSRNAANASAHGRGTCSAHCCAAELLGRLGSGMLAEAWTELDRARAAIVSPGDEAQVLAIAIYLCRVDHDVVQIGRWEQRLYQHTKTYRGHPEVERWWPRARTCVAELAATCGDTRQAIEHLRFALDELPVMEPDATVAAEMRSIIAVYLTWHYLSTGQRDPARDSLATCAAGPYLARFEALRCCAEAEYSLQGGDVDSAQSWIKLAKAAQVGRPEALVRQTMVQAKLAYAAGERETAWLMATEARRLCARHKQDQLAGAVSALFRGLFGAAPAAPRRMTIGRSAGVLVDGALLISST